jgi:hypothetical protein
MSDYVYPSFATDISAHTINLDTDEFYVMLVDKRYVPSATHTKRSDISGEISGTGYTAGGLPLSHTITDVGAVTNLIGTPIQWENSSFTARGGVMYQRTGGPASSDRLVKYFDFREDLTCDNARFWIVFDFKGVIQVEYL